GATVEARYLFGAPMAGALVGWAARMQPLSSWQLEIPNTDGYLIGESGWWWEDESSDDDNVRLVNIQEGRDTLDAHGHAVVRLKIPAPPKGRAARLSVSSAVTDVNRQVVGAATSVTVHPAAIYLAAKPLGDEYFWKSGQAVSIALLAVTPEGHRVGNVAIRGTVARREWHRVRRERDGLSEVVGDWVTDTVGQCSVTTDTLPRNCEFTPKAGGSYILTFRATDNAGREAATSFYRWATGSDWVPWDDRNQFRMDVIADKTRYTVGDTATILIAAPFTNAEAWLTVEREGVILQRRFRVTAGSTSIALPITEAFAPNVFVSVMLARGRSAPPGKTDDPGRPTIRVGYTELRVAPEIKRLTVDLDPARAEYRPGDTVQVGIRVQDIAHVGRRAEVTLWAVDEGVLALTSYKTPDPIDLIYRARGLGVRLASNLVSVAAQEVTVEATGVTEKGHNPGGGGGAAMEDILRSRFQTTAFFLGSVTTDAQGRGVARAKLPDNLTTFRIMAVAVTAGDRYGSGHTPLLVTRALLARPALPRFVRPGDQFAAGVVVHQRAGGDMAVRVEATASGAVSLGSKRVDSARVANGRGTEVRFPFSTGVADSAVFRFRVTGGPNADAVETRVPERPDFHVRTHTVAGVVRDTAQVTFVLPPDIDPARSRLRLSLGTSPLAIIRGARRTFVTYPYDCTEQISSEMEPVIALVRAGQALHDTAIAPPGAMSEIALAVGVLTRRQRTDGGIGLWSATDWTTPWLSAYAGIALLDARAAGVPVSDSVLNLLRDYLVRTTQTDQVIIQAPVGRWYSAFRIGLADRVATADFLARLGQPSLPLVNTLLRVAPQLRWEDRVRLAEIAARSGAAASARSLLEPTWADVKIEGKRAVLPDSAYDDFYFASSARPAARLLSATVAVDPANALVGPLVETLIEIGRGGRRSYWNTQDYGAAVVALSALEQDRRAGDRIVRVRTGGRDLLRAVRAADHPVDSAVALSGLLTDQPDGTKNLTLAVNATGSGPGVFYYLDVEETPLHQPVRPDQQGIQVDRWYEGFDDHKPTITAVEGDLVRVRLKITVSAERQFFVLSDALPAGLEAVDVSLHTASGTPEANDAGASEEREPSQTNRWWYGSWENGWWSPFDHRELRDDRVVYVATVLWPGTYDVTYVARATTPGTFVRPVAWAEEMYNPGVQGRTDGGVFTVTAKVPPGQR
ncbi:MAG TPA: alpha-2-macroglobulin family protein, partial [Gemmatimonadales bacterium]